MLLFFFFSSRRRHTRCLSDWSSDVCSSDLLNPPDKALVLCCDEKSQCQALERTQPGLPLGNRSYSHPGPRLQTAWDDHLVCRTKLPGRQDPVPHRDPSHACRVAALPETARPGNAFRAATAPDRRQLCNAQTRKSAPLAEATCARHPALHADRQFLDEPGGALLRGPDSRLCTGGEFRKRTRTDRSDRRVPGSAERRAETVCMARQRGRHPAQDRESKGGAGSSYYQLIR